MTKAQPVNPSKLFSQMRPARVVLQQQLEQGDSPEAPPGVQARARLLRRLGDAQEAAVPYDRDDCARLILAKVLTPDEGSHWRRTGRLRLNKAQALDVDVRPTQQVQVPALLLTAAALGGRPGRSKNGGPRR